MPGISHLFSRIQTTKHAHLLGSFQRASAQCKALPTGGNAICKSFTPTMQPVERMQQPSTFDLWLRRLWRLWHGTNASHACAEHCCLLIGQLIQFSTTRMTWKAGGSRQLNTEGTQWNTFEVNHIWWQWNASQELWNIFGRIPGLIITLPETDMAPWKRRWRRTRKPWFLGVNSLRRLTFQYFSDVFRSCLWDLGPASEVFGKKVRYQHLHFVPCKPPPLHRSMSAVKIFVYSTCSRGKRRCAGLKFWGRWKLTWQTSEKDHKLRWQNE